MIRSVYKMQITDDRAYYYATKGSENKELHVVLVKLIWLFEKQILYLNSDLVKDLTRFCNKNTTNKSTAGIGSIGRLRLPGGTEFPLYMKDQY